jgi:hypothetical protein
MIIVIMLDIPTRQPRKMLAHTKEEPSLEEGSEWASYSEPLAP